MTPFSFAVVVEGFDDTDESAVDALGSYDEVVMISSTDAVVSIDLFVDAVDAAAAIRAGVALIERAVDGARAIRIDEDLVAATDIAARVGVSRQAVNQWATSTRGFPAPVGHVAGGTRVWPWSLVVPWLESHGHATDETALPHRAIIEANAWLGSRRSTANRVTPGKWRRAPNLRTANKPMRLGGPALVVVPQASRSGVTASAA